MIRIIDRSQVAAVETRRQTGRLAPQRTEPGSDRVSVSGEAQRLREAEARRLSELADAVASGRYKVDVDRLAGAIADDLVNIATDEA